MPQESELQREIERRRALTMPAVESLLAAEALLAGWPEEVANSAEFKADRDARKLLRDRLDVVLRGMSRPDVSLEQALENGLVTEDQVADLFASLTPLLARGSEYQRLALYLPFELMPDANSDFRAARLQSESEKLRDAFMQAWGRLLRVHDVRANFVDGDVLEVDKRTGDLPRVVKAAHLIPKLVEKHWLRVDDIVYIAEHNSDDVLLASIAEAVSVLGDMGITTPRLDEIRREHFVPRASTDDDGTPMTEKRKAWLESESRRRASAARARTIASSILDGSRAVDDVDAASADDSVALVTGIRDAIEATAKHNVAAARAMYEEVQSKLDALRKQSPPDVLDALARLAFRLHALHVVTDDELRTRKLTRPSLAGPFSKNVERMQGNVRDIAQAAKAIERDPVLAAALYPAVLFFGSRVKGYGAENADVDVGVFVRPGVDRGRADALRALMKTLFKNEEPLEFWLKADGDQLRVDDAGDYDPHVGERHFTHILFGAAWEGNTNAIAELRAKFLAPYFVDKSEQMFGRDARALYIEEMERDALQYRLMHKGYERFFPPFGGVNTEHASAVDGESMFWDSGYRQTATKLFVTNVFLPKLASSSRP